MQVRDGITRSAKRNYPSLIVLLLNAKLPRDLRNGLILPSFLFASVGRGAQDLAAIELQKSLQGFVDQWINSAKSKNGEEPWNRYLTKSVVQEIEELHRRFPPGVQFVEGRPTISLFPPIPFWEANVQASQKDQVIARARDFALFHFVQFLDSPARERLFRCDACNKYFVLERAPRKQIKGGSYCVRGHCRRRASASRMITSREKRKAEMTKFAADSWSEFNGDSSRRSEWIAAKVNRRTARINIKSAGQTSNPYPRITGRWVSQHRHEIEAIVERRKHAEME